MTDCLIIGGGIIGMMTARELSKEGLSVTLVDSGNCTKNSSSWAGAGIISPLYPWKYSPFINELSNHSQRIYERICTELLDATGIDPEYIKSGLKMFDEFESDIAQQWLTENNLTYTKEGNTALFDIAQVRNPQILKALKKDLELRGVTIVEETTIHKLRTENGAIIGADNFLAKYTIVCAGSYSHRLISQNVYPVKGQIITIFDPKRTIKNICLKGGNYLVPRKDGTVLVGATMENVAYNNDLNEEVKQSLLDFATGLFPHLAECEIINHWCGFRPGCTTDPIIQADETFDNLFINTGHFRNGLNTAPQSANILLNLIKTQEKC